MAKLIVRKVTFKEPVDELPGGPRKFLTTDPALGGSGWNIFADTVSREIVIDPPALGGRTPERIRVPFEQVKQYVAGIVAPKSLTAEDLALASD